MRMEKGGRLEKEISQDKKGHGKKEGEVSEHELVRLRKRGPREGKKRGSVKRSDRRQIEKGHHQDEKARFAGDRKKGKI